MLQTSDLIKQKPGRIMNAVRDRKKVCFIIFILNKGNELAISELLMVLCRVCLLDNFFRRDINQASWTVGSTGYSTCFKIGTWSFQSTVKQIGTWSCQSTILIKFYLDVTLQLNFFGFYSKLQQSTDHYNPNIWEVSFGSTWVRCYFCSKRWR